MTDYLVVYQDGRNGMCRGGVTQTLPASAIEQAPGSKIFETEDGMAWYVELLGSQEPVFAPEESDVEVTSCEVSNSDDRSYGDCKIEWEIPQGLLALEAQVHTGSLVDEEWTLDSVPLEDSPPDIQLPAMQEGDFLNMTDTQFVESLRRDVAAWVKGQS